MEKENAKFLDIQEGLKGMLYFNCLVCIFADASRKNGAIPNSDRSKARRDDPLDGEGQ